MFWLSFVFVVISVVLQVLFRFAAVGRLTIPLLYFLIMAFVCPKWAGEHEALTLGILIAMLVLVAISWVVTIVSRCIWSMASCRYCFSSSL